MSWPLHFSGPTPIRATCSRTGWPTTSACGGILPSRSPGSDSSTQLTLRKLMTDSRGVSRLLAEAAAAVLVLIPQSRTANSPGLPLPSWSITFVKRSGLAITHPPMLSRIFLTVRLDFHYLKPKQGLPRACKSVLPCLTVALALFH